LILAKRPRRLKTVDISDGYIEGGGHEVDGPEGTEALMKARPPHFPRSLPSTIPSII